jgi:hypothetical protein
MAALIAGSSGFLLDARLHTLKLGGIGTGSTFGLLGCWGQGWDRQRIGFNGLNGRDLWIDVIVVPSAIRSTTPRAVFMVFGPNGS